MKKLALLMIPFIFSCFMGCNKQDSNQTNKQDTDRSSPCGNGYNRDQMRRNNQ